MVDSRLVEGRRILMREDAPFLSGSHALETRKAPQTHPISSQYDYCKVTIISNKERVVFALFIACSSKLMKSDEAGRIGNSPK